MKEHFPKSCQTTIGKRLVRLLMRQTSGNACLKSHVRKSAKSDKTVLAKRRLLSSSASAALSSWAVKIGQFGPNFPAAAVDRIGKSFLVYRKSLNKLDGAAKLALAGRGQELRFLRGWSQQMCQRRRKLLLGFSKLFLLESLDTLQNDQSNFVIL